MTEPRTEERRAVRRITVANPRRTRLTGTHSGDLTCRLAPEQRRPQDEGR